MTNTVSDQNPLLNSNDLRICHIRGIDSLDTRVGGTSLLDVLDLGRLSDAFEAADELAPRIGAVATRSSLQLTGERSGAFNSEWQRYRLIVPSCGLVDVRALSIRWPDNLTEAINLLEDLNYEAVEGEPLRWDTEHVDDIGPPSTNVGPFHQLIFVPGNTSEPTWEEIQRLIYRADLEAIEEHSSIRHPDELNRRPDQMAAIGRFGSVLWGHQDYIEASLVVSAAVAVSASSTVQSVQRAARSQLLNARKLLLANDDHDSSELCRATAMLGVDLAVCAEAQVDVANLLPSLRVVSYHQALYEAADLYPQIDVARRLLDRLAITLDLKRGIG